MDWMPDDPTFLPHDWKNFEYEERNAKIIRKLQKDETLAENVLSTPDEWESWFSDAIGVSPQDEERAGLHLLLLSRAPDVFEGTSSPPSYLPLTLSTWGRVVKSWHVHRGITRIISRRIACFSVSKSFNKSNQLQISYLARMSAELPEDLALSMTFIPTTKSQFCIFYGCNSSQMRRIQKRVSVTGDGLQHPLTVVGVFMETERERLVNKVDDLVDKFTLRAEILEQKYWSPDLHVDSPKTRENLAICLHSRELVDQMRSAKRQLSKFIIHIECFNEWMEGKCIEVAAPITEEKDRVKLKEIGEKIKNRLQDILYEYDDKIDECKMISGSLSLAMQTLWNQIAQKDSQTNTHIAHVNTMIAMETKRENVQMKSIALLTMIYIPLSCVASVFSTSLFNFPSDGQSVVSNYIWVFILSSLILTLMTVGIWHYATSWYGDKKEKRSNSFKLMETDNIV